MIYDLLLFSDSKASPDHVHIGLCDLVQSAPLILGHSRADLALDM